MRFLVLMAVSMMITLITLMLEEASTSETLVSFCETAWCNIPEDSHLQSSNESEAPNTLIKVSSRYFFIMFMQPQTFTLSTSAGEEE
jgi:hypothetical protein